MVYRYYTCDTTRHKVLHDFLSRGIWYGIWYTLCLVVFGIPYVYDFLSRLKVYLSRHTVYQRYRMISCLVVFGIPYV